VWAARRKDHAERAAKIVVLTDLDEIEVELSLG